MMSIKTLMIEIRRKILNIFSPEFASIFYTNTDGQALPFVPNNRMKYSASLILESGGLPPDSRITKQELRKLLFC